MGEVFDGNGVVVAPSAEGRSLALGRDHGRDGRASAAKGDEEPLGLNGVIEQATSGLRESGQNFETLQRQQRTVDHQPAQMLKTRYHEKSTGRDWVEEMIFIEGPQNEIYSVVLKCSPQSLAQLEPVLNGVLAGWTLPGPPQDRQMKMRQRSLLRRKRRHRLTHRTKIA